MMTSPEALGNSFKFINESPVVNRVINVAGDRYDLFNLFLGPETKDVEFLSNYFKMMETKEIKTKDSMDIKRNCVFTSGPNVDMQVAAYAFSYSVELVGGSLAISIYSEMINTNPSWRNKGFSAKIVDDIVLEIMPLVAEAVSLTKITSIHLYSGGWWESEGGRVVTTKLHDGMIDAIAKLGQLDFTSELDMDYV